MNPAHGMRTTPFRLGRWRIYPDRHELCADDGTVRRIPPLLIALLLRLVQADGRTASRDELLSSVWQRREVNDEVLSRAIADLRRALGDDARQPRLIETVPKLGYRLLARTGPVHADESGTATSGPAHHRTTRQGRLPAAAVGLGLVAVGLLVAGVLAWRVFQSPTSSLPGPLAADMVHARPLVSDPGLSMTPRFSRTGELIAYSASESGSGTARVHVRSRDGRVTSTIENDGQWDICPVFSQGGGDLFWTRHSDTACRLMRVPLSGGSPQDLAACAHGVRSCPDLAPDGQAIVFTAAVDEPAGGIGLVSLDLADGTLTALPDPAIGPMNDAEPRFSPDGRHLAFLRGQATARRLYIADADGQRARPVPLRDARIHGLTWLDDAHLLLATDSEGFRALVRLNIDDGSRSLLGGAGAQYPDRASDGALVWEVAHYQANLWKVDAEGNERQLTRHRRSDGGQVLSPDGRQLAFQSNREGPDSLWLLALATGEEQRLPLPASDTWTDPAWSPDGRTILMSRYHGATSQVWSYRLGTAAPQRVPGIPDDAHDGQFAPDGTHIWYVITSLEGDRVLWRQTLAEGDEAMSPLDWPIDSFVAHAAGLFVQRPLDGGLWRCDDAGRSCLALAGPAGAAGTPSENWTLTGSAIYRQAADENGASAIWRTSLDGNAAERMSWPPSTSGRSFAVLSDGNSAVIARGALTQLELGWLPPPSQRQR
jgi:Tol biopolymer transport system component/DNA-binding winged helix-turn-helix (wHTH) protein